MSVSQIYATLFQLLFLFGFTFRFGWIICDILRDIVEILVDKFCANRHRKP